MKVHVNIEPIIYKIGRITEKIRTVSCLNMVTFEQVRMEEEIRKDTTVI